MMSFIEGVGDEVVAFAVILLVLVLAATVTFFLNSSPFTEHQQTSQVQNESSSLQVIQIYYSLIVLICFTRKNIVVSILMPIK